MQDRVSQGNRTLVQITGDRGRRERGRRCGL